MKPPPPLYARHPHPRTARPALIGAPFLLFLLALSCALAGLIYCIQ